MRNFASLKAIALGLCLVAAGPVAAASAAPGQQFDVGYGWDAGFVYAQPEALRPAQGAGDTVGATSGGFSAMPVESMLAVSLTSQAKAATVPVPGSLALLASGLVLLAVVGRRRSPRRSAGTVAS